MTFSMADRGGAARFRLPPNFLTEQVLRPGLLTATHQAMASMHPNRARSLRQRHAGLRGSPVPLAVVAAQAARHQILPGGIARARAWNHMVQRQLLRGRLY